MVRKFKKGIYMEENILKISINDLIERGFQKQEAKDIMDKYIHNLIDEIWIIQSNFLDNLENKFEKNFL